MHDMFEDLVFQRQLEKIETTNWVMDGRSRDVSNRIDTQWREFIREPTPLSDMCGPTHLQLSPIALRDQVSPSSSSSTLSAQPPSRSPPLSLRSMAPAVQHHLSRMTVIGSSQPSSNRNSSTIISIREVSIS